MYTDRLEKQNMAQPMERYFALKREEMPTHAPTLLDLEDIMLSETRVLEGQQTAQGLPGGSRDRSALGNASACDSQSPAALAATGRRGQGRPHLALRSMAECTAVRHNLHHPARMLCDLSWPTGRAGWGREAAWLRASEEAQPGKHQGPGRDMDGADDWDRGAAEAEQQQGHHASCRGEHGQHCVYSDRALPPGNLTAGGESTGTVPSH